LAKKFLYLPLLIIPLIIGLIHGFAIAKSTNIFISWLSIGFWLCITFYFFRKSKTYREFGSPHNTVLFILGPSLVGILYCLIGYFTGLLEENFLGNPGIYFSLWTFLFAFPYLGYGAFTLYSCFRRYDVIYLNSRRSISARGFGIFATSLTITVEFFIILFFLITGGLSSPLEIVHSSPDLMLLILGLFSIFLLIRYGIFWTQPSLSEISAAVTARRRERIEEPILPRPATRTSSELSVSTTSRSTSTSRSSSSSSPPSTRSRSISSRESSTTTTRRKEKEEAKQKPKIDVKKFRPKAGRLSLEDFKCIICFKLPDPATDKRRGIVLCPKCKHPAHADEFKDWLKNSNLCSRCDTPIPARFRQNPEIIDVELYIKLFVKKMKQ
jgi:hypothetical protein